MKDDKGLALKRLINNQISEDWKLWSEEHPNLSAFIDHNKLVELTVQEIDRDENIKNMLEGLAIEEYQYQVIHRLIQSIQRKIKFCAKTMGI
ncbi:hypothetical protein JD969_09025 [Planctomycetota bacterium]|nr:hypothetical protein JD969_09025 [Planctomycetota bacterium]